MNNAEFVKLIIFSVCFFVFLTVVAVLILKFRLTGFHRRCRAIGLSPSPVDRWFCVGNWQDARVAVQRCGTRYCNTVYVYMDLGELPAEAVRKISYYMQGLGADYYSLAGYEGNLEFYKIVSGSWQVPYLYSSHLRLNANEFHIRKMLEALHQIRKEIRRRMNLR